MAEKDKEATYFSYFRNLYESWEKSTNQALEIWLNNPLFHNRMEKTVEKSAEFRNYMRDIMERTIKYKYVPTSMDLTRIAETLDSLEGKLKKLEDKISELEHVKEPETEPKTEKTRRKMNERAKI